VERFLALLLVVVVTAALDDAIAAAETRWLESLWTGS
jgi:hypothetical protein